MFLMPTSPPRTKAASQRPGATEPVWKDRLPQNGWHDNGTRLEKFLGGGYGY